MMPHSVLVFHKYGNAPVRLLAPTTMMEITTIQWLYFSSAQRIKTAANSFLTSIRKSQWPTCMAPIKDLVCYCSAWQWAFKHNHGAFTQAFSRIASFIISNKWAWACFVLCYSGTITGNILLWHCVMVEFWNKLSSTSPFYRSFFPCPMKLDLLCPSSWFICHYSPHGYMLWGSISN